MEALLGFSRRSEQVEVVRWKLGKKVGF